MIDRRQFLQSATATAGLAAAGFSVPALAQQGLKMGGAETLLVRGAEKARPDMAAHALCAAPAPLARDPAADRLRRARQDQVQDRSRALGQWPERVPGHLLPSRPLLPEAGAHACGREAAQAREIIYDTAYFDMPEDSPAHQLPDNSGFAGFRFQEARNGKLDWRKNDWVAFLGASYFRAIGELYQYGLSARGLAVDVAVFGKNEEFPDFTHVYFETPQAGSDTVTVYALLDGPSVAGAYRFVMQRTAAVIMDIDSTLFMRQDVSRLGIAPLTSMYWYSEKAKADRHRLAPRDPRFRRPRDVDRRRASASGARSTTRPGSSPRPSATRTRRASACCSATGTSTIISTASITTAGPRSGSSRKATGAGASIQLVEIPTDDEIHDNIVAMWVPADPALRRQALKFRYRMHWSAEEPYPTTARPRRGDPARQWRAGRDGPRPKGVRKFMVEFTGEPLTTSAQRRDPAARAHGLPRRVLQHLDRSRARRRAWPLAHPVRP